MKKYNPILIALSVFAVLTFQHALYAASNLTPPSDGAMLTVYAPQKPVFYKEFSGLACGEGGWTCLSKPTITIQENTLISKVSGFLMHCPSKNPVPWCAPSTVDFVNAVSVGKCRLWVHQSFAYNEEQNNYRCTASTVKPWVPEACKGFSTKLMSEKSGDTHHYILTILQVPTFK